MFTIKFLGAAETVTGSSYLVEYNDVKFLVDHGMFQGPDVEGRNADPYDFNPADLDFILLTHAHIDHSGMLPKLVKHGFHGPIYATNHSISITTLLLLDSAKIQEYNEAEGVFGTGAKSYYNTRDAEQTISQFRSVKFNESVDLPGGITAEYIPAGHILGAASIIVELDGKRIAFSGDIGRVKHSLIKSFDVEDEREVDYVLMESLYGGQMHPPRETSVQQLINIIRTTTDGAGNVLIPAFAVDRTQGIMIDIKHAKEAGTLNGDMPVFVDSPLANRVTDIYRSALNALNLEVPEGVDITDVDPFEMPALKIIRSGKQSRRLGKKNGSVIIAGSGMVNGGRILGHIVAHMGEKKNSLVLVGYQAEETMGRALSEGVRELEIDGIPVTIKGRVEHLQGFSAHGDESDLLAWLGRYRSDRLKNIMLVHADIDRSQAFADTLQRENYGKGIIIPKWKQVIEL